MSDLKRELMKGRLRMIIRLSILRNLQQPLYVVQHNFVFISIEVRCKVVNNAR